MSHNIVEIYGRIETYQTPPHLAFCTPGQNQVEKRFSIIDHTTLLMLLGTVFLVIIAKSTCYANNPTTQHRLNSIYGLTFVSRLKRLSGQVSIALSHIGESYFTPLY